MKTLWYALARQADIERWTAGALANAAAVDKAAAAVEQPVRTGQVARTEPPVTAAAPPAPAGSCEQLVAQYFPDDTQWALAVARRESHCTAGAVNNEGCDTSGRTSSHALGVFQMCYPLHQASFSAVGCSNPLDLECGIRAARALYDANGRSPWGG